MTTRMTQSLADRAARGGDRETLYDAEVPGLRLRVGRRSASWLLVGTVNDGRSTPVSLTLGRADQLTLREARAEARRLKLELSRGVDPREARMREGEAAVTAREALERYLSERPDLSPATVDYYRHWTERMGRTADRPVASVTRAEARRLFNRVTEESGRYAANAVARTGRALWADVLRERDLPEGNVWARAVRMHEERPREWALSDGELRAFWAAADRRSPVRRAAWWTLALTGLRMAEAAGLRWEDVDLDGGAAWVARPKGGEHRAFLRPLPSALVAELAALRAETEPLGSPWVLPARGGGRISTLRSDDAGLPPPHALRHTWATRALDLGAEMSTVSLALNHAGKGTTWRYVRRDRVQAPVREATERVAAHLLSFRGD